MCSNDDDGGGDGGMHVVLPAPPSIQDVMQRKRLNPIVDQGNVIAFSLLRSCRPGRMAGHQEHGKKGRGRRGNEE